MNAHTYHEIATDYALWGEYHDPDNTMTREEFDAMTIDQRIASIVACNGPEDARDEIEAE